MSGWSKAELARAAELWNDGYSAEDISMMLSREFDTMRSRNSVVGIAHRHRDLFRRKGRLQVVPKTREELRKRFTGNGARWSQAEKAHAARLWREGMAPALIAQELSVRFGTRRTDKSVYALAKAEPERFPRRSAKGQCAGNIWAKQAARAADPEFIRPEPMAVGKVEAAAYDAASRHAPLDDLEWSDCRWPVNDAARGEVHLFCGLHAEKPGGYCAHHAQRAWGEGTRGENAAERTLARMGRAA